MSNINENNLLLKTKQYVKVMIKFFYKVLKK